MNSHRGPIVDRMVDQQNQSGRSAGYFVGTDSVPRFDSLRLSVVRFRFVDDVRRCTRACTPRRGEEKESELARGLGWFFRTGDQRAFACGDMGRAIGYVALAVGDASWPARRFIAHWCSRRATLRGATRRPVARSGLAHAARVTGRSGLAA